MRRYKVTLKPVGWFFFGGEQTFGEGQNFIVSSNRWPQQTTLLGMLRYQLLKKAGKLLQSPDDKPDETIIGRDSFNMARATAGDYGKIKRLSPVFIQQGDQRFIPAPLTLGYDCSFDPDVRVWMNGKEQSGMLEAKGYQEKGYRNYQILIDQHNQCRDADDFFLAQFQVGIAKSIGEEDDSKAFFQQETLRFRDPETVYAFYAELADDAVLDTDDFVFIGAQRSCFKFHLEPSDELMPSPDHPGHSILLLSPAYFCDVDELNACCRFHWSYGIPFRNINRSQNGTLKAGKVSYARASSVCTLLAAGSVLFYQSEEKDKLDKLIQMLNNEHLQQIGYNQYDIK